MPDGRRSRIAATVTALTVSYLFGYLSHALVLADEHEGSAAPYLQLETFARVLSHIETSYVDTVVGEDLVYGAIKGMVDTLDPHSSFLTPEEHQAMRAETRGEYVGVGMELGERDDNITIVAPFEGGPAYEAGIESGDVIVSIDGTRIADANLQDIVRQLRGELGAPVEIGVRRGTGATATELSFTVVRDIIRMQAVRTSLLAPGIGMIAISSFQLGVSDDLVAAIDALSAQNGGTLSGLVLDLRNNPGGLLSEGIAVSDVFLDDGLVVTTEGRDATENETHGSRDATTRYDRPLVVLVNSGTASASEIVAGALRDRQRATIFGTTTFGKATVQSIIDFADGSGLKLTVARYYTPSHVTIHGAGIEPHEFVESATVEADSESTPDGFESVTDAQIQAALDHLLSVE